MAQGVKESEIGYQTAFNKQELRKVIASYPGREVKKGLESLYKKVEKHLSEESNLLQVNVGCLLEKIRLCMPFVVRLCGELCKKNSSASTGLLRI